MILLRLRAGGEVGESSYQQTHEFRYFGYFVVRRIGDRYHDTRRRSVDPSHQSCSHEVKHRGTSGDSPACKSSGGECE